MIERGFDTLYFWMHVMMYHRVLHENLKNFLCPEYVATMNKPENNYCRSSMGYDVVLPPMSTTAEGAQGGVCQVVRN